MADVYPFSALRPFPAWVDQVACPPYDVIRTDEARSLADGKPYSFLRVIRPEIGFPPGMDEHDDQVYRAGAATLERFAASEVFTAESEQSLYVYQLDMEGRLQTGLFACVATRDYDQGLIVRHEKTRPDKEDDRTRHILAQRAHAEPVMLTFRPTPRLKDLLREVTRSASLFDFVAEDGIRHTMWKVSDPETFVSAFQPVERIYVADGHHRCAAASRAAHSGVGDSVENARFPAVLFPMDQMRILPYHRVIRRCPAGAEAFLRDLTARYPFEPSGSPMPGLPGTVSVYLNGRWTGISLPESERTGVADQLDVARLSEFVLEPLLGISDVRTDPNMAFVGGIRGTEELRRLVDTGEAEAAIAMYPTSIDELIAVSDAGELMPPKSTWFEPKLRSGLLVHRF